jgi:hypothetical protein
VNEEDKIYADQGDQAILYVDGRPPTVCPTLREAKLAWKHLSPEEKKTATIKVVGGRVYGPDEIDRLHHLRRPFTDTFGIM